jgi:hypothetical protein
MTIKYNFTKQTKKKGKNNYSKKAGGVVRHQNNKKKESNQSNPRLKNTIHGIQYRIYWCTV